MIKFATIGSPALKKCYLCGKLSDDFGFANSFDLLSFPCVPPPSGSVVILCLDCLDEVHDYANKLWYAGLEEIESEDIFNA